MKRKKIFIGIVALIVLSAGLLIAQTVTKGFIGKQDFSLWDGGSTKTFTRETSSGYDLTLNKVDWPGVDVLQVYGGGAARNDASISAAVSATTGLKVPLWLSPGTWTISNDVSFEAGTIPIIPPGAILTISSGKTLTFAGTTIQAGGYQIFSGAGEIDFADGTETRLSWFASLSAAVGYIDSDRVRILVDRSETISDDLTIPANIDLDFINGSVLTIATAKTLTINSTLQPGLMNHIFTCAETGKVVFGTAREVYAGWWPDWTTDAGVAWSAAVASIKAVGGKVKLPGGAAVLTTPVNMTGITGVYLDVEGVNNSTAITIAATTMGLDCTGSNHLTFKDFKIIGDGTTTPDVGFFFARDTSAGNGLFHYFYNIVSSGKFTKAVVYSYGSEENRYYNCYFHNTNDAGACFWSTGDNDGDGEDVTSVYTTTATGAQSNSDNQFFGCGFLATGTGSTDNIRLRGVLNLNFYGTFLANTGTNPRSHIYVDNDGAETSFISMEGFRGETGTTVQYGIYVNGATQCTDWIIRNGYWAPVLSSFYHATALSKIQVLTWENISGEGSDGMIFRKLQYGFVRTLTEINVLEDLSNSTIFCTRSIASFATNATNFIFYSDDRTADGISHINADSASYDFVLTDLTTDGAWHDLDLSVAGIAVSPGARFVLISALIQDDAAGSSIFLRQNGNSNEIQCSFLYTQVANIYVGKDIIVPCDATGKIEYKATNTTWSGIFLTVKGWW
jgi:hypothetical protein